MTTEEQTAQEARDREARVSRLFADMEASKQARMDLGLEG